MDKQEIEDIQALINIFFPFGEELLIKFGEFFPYAGATTIEGDFVTVGNPDQKGMSDAKKVIEQLKNDLHIGSGQYLVAAVFYDVRTKDSITGQTSDAIAVHVEHKDGNTAYEFFYPYKLEGKDNFLVEDSYGNSIPKEIFQTETGPLRQ